MSESSLPRFLEQHPRMIGVLFVLSVLLTQAAPMVAACNDCAGP